MKAPGDYSDQFGSNKMSVLLCEGPKPNMFMISGFGGPWEPSFLDLNIPNYFKKHKNNYGNLFETYYFYKSQYCGNRKFRNVGPDVEKMGTGNDEDPINKNVEILNMGPTSIEKHEMYTS